MQGFRVRSSGGPTLFFHVTFPLSYPKKYKKLVGTYFYVAIKYSTIQIGCREETYTHMFKGKSDLRSRHVIYYLPAGLSMRMTRSWLPVLVCPELR